MGVDLSRCIILCRLHKFLAYWSSHLSGWILVALTVDRALALCVPLRAKFWNGRLRALWIVIALALSLFALNMHFLWSSANIIIRLNNGTRLEYPCYFQETYLHFYMSVWPWIDFLLLSLLPTLLLISGNSLIIGALTRAREERFASPGMAPLASHDQVTSMSIILLRVSGIYLVTSLPLTSFIAANKVYDVNNEKVDIATLELVRTIFTQLYYVNSAINFWLYCYSGSRVRIELARIFACFKIKFEWARNTNISEGRHDNNLPMTTTSALDDSKLHSR